ncbi:MAG: ABC transporter permease subunit [Oscillospiraceae bacterium]|jgi:NitT/TauT family transport system permease protein|nr:ABC transporter permease subunit [Oscillospiraceae bacterium]
MTRALKSLFTVSNGLFVVFLLIQLLPNRAGGRIADKPLYTVALVSVLEVFLLTSGFFVKKKELRNVISDIIGFVYIVLIFWVLATVKLNVVSNAKSAVFPPPGAVLAQFVSDIKITVTNVRDSLDLVFRGYLLAMITAIPLGLILGWNVRVGAAATYITKFLSSISPLVYTPYAIVLLPSFRAASIFVIFVASFWPTLAGTMSGVLNVEKNIIDSAKTLSVGRVTMLSRVVLPASLPQVFIGCNQGLSISFILLVSAEMIGARSGIGYYVNNYVNFGNYTSALAGVFVIGIVVSVITFFFNLLQRFLLRWKKR